MSFNNTKTPRKPTKKARWQVPQRKCKAGPMEFYIEGEIKDKFCKLFPIHSNRRIMEWFGISFSTMQRFKRELGLKKNMKTIRKELARDVKKICENNGYYDSIRGKPVSEACQEGLRRIYAEGFHPLKRMKIINPRKYKKILLKRSEQRKSLCKTERRRMAWGFEKKTKVNVKLYKLPSNASSLKHAMIKRNNYFADPEHSSWVCYDSHTRRSQRREATAIKHGLRIVAADE